MLRALDRILLYNTRGPWGVRRGSPRPHASFGVLRPGVGYGVALASLKLELVFAFGLGLGLGWLVFLFGLAWLGLAWLGLAHLGLCWLGLVCVRSACLVLSCLVLSCLVSSWPRVSGIDVLVLCAFPLSW